MDSGAINDTSGSNAALFDKDSAALLMLLINDYISSNSFKNFEAFIKGDIE